jgi:hypothetical protein
LSWFDENPAWLAELVASLARAGADHVVALDGAYASYPQAAGNSGSEQAQIVVSTALGCGIGATVHAPQWPWAGGEVEKRSALFAFGHVIADAGEDWLMVADADEVWGPAGDLRDRLAATELDCGEVLLEEHVAQGAHEWNRQPIRKLFRAQESGISVQGHHARYVSGDGDVLWDAARPNQQALSESLWDVRVRHRPADRAAYRNEKRMTYYSRRSDFGLEVA